MDLGSEEIQVPAALVSVIEAMEAETLPPTTCIGVRRTDDHGATCRLGIELSSSGENVRDQCRAHALLVTATVDSQAAKQQGGNGIWSVLGDTRRRR